MPGIALPLAIAIVLGGTVLVNEWSDGGVASAMGLGPRHMFEGRAACMAGDPAPMCAMGVPPHG